MERFLIFFGSMALAALCTPLVFKFARAKGVVDLPNQERKRHSTPTPLWGGLAIWFALAIVGVIAWRFGLLTDVKIGNTQLLGIALASLLLVCGRIFDHP